MTRNNFPEHLLALARYEDIGRALPADDKTWTPEQRRKLIAARDAYYAALKERTDVPTR